MIPIKVSHFLKKEREDKDNHREYKIYKISLVLMYSSCCYDVVDDYNGNNNNDNNNDNNNNNNNNPSIT